jgi:glycerol transport system substrate-binding protein
MTDLAPKLGGLVEFYRSPARVAWTPTGTNVPDYPKLAQLWWKNVAVAVTGEKTPQAAMDNLAEEMDQVMARLERAGMARCAPKLNKKEATRRSGCPTRARPWAKLANEKPKGDVPSVTIAYDTATAERLEGGQGALMLRLLACTRPCLVASTAASARLDTLSFL